MAKEVAVAGFERTSGRLVIHCDGAGLERLVDAVCRAGGVFVPLVVPSAPVRTVSIELAADAAPRPVRWHRVLASYIICLALFVLAPAGLTAVIGILLG